MTNSTSSDSNERFNQEVAVRFGVLPNFFCSAPAAPGLIEELWGFAKSAYLDNPLNSLFKERLFVYLSRYCVIRYCVVRHVGFLLGHGRPAGDAEASPESLDAVMLLLSRPVPDSEALQAALERLTKVELHEDLPAPGSPVEQDLFDVLSVLFIEPMAGTSVAPVLRAAVGDKTFELLVAFLAFIRTAHYWTETHPELAFEPDMLQLMSDHPMLADRLLDDSDAKRLRDLHTLRDTVVGLRASLRASDQRLHQAIDALRASEKRLREANDRKDEFIAMLAHELRNPLTPIRSGLEVLKLTSKDPATERLRSMMERHVVHIVRLVDDLLDVSRITSGKIRLQRKTSVLQDLVASAVEANRSAIDAKKIALQLDMPQEACLLDVDPTRFVQVISNLLNNAAKFSDEHGQIRLAARVAKLESGTRDLVLSVRDSGAGIQAELLPHVFDLFKQGEHSSSLNGLGIGLALARKMVEMHGGRIEALSAGPGLGSEFTLHLPLARDSARPDTAAEAAGTAPDVAACRVVVIDDNHDVADITTMLLQSLGAICVAAYDGEAGVAAVRQQRPDVVLVDLGMPVVDGFEVARRIREELGSSIRLVALSGFGQEEDRRRSALSGFDAHLTKPAELAELERVLELVCAAKRS